MRLFLDTSALAKRYVEEQGSDHVDRLCREAESLTLSVVCIPEMISTLHRLLREGRLARHEYEHLKASFLSDAADANLCELTPDVAATALRVIEETGLRTLDALHLASALVAETEMFVSADHAQIVAARRFDLETTTV